MFFAVRLVRGGPWDWARDLREQEGFAEHARFMDSLVDEAEDSWHQNGMLTVKSIEPWTILLDGRPG